MEQQAKPLEKIQRVPVVQQVEQAVADLIAGGTYRPGDKLPAEMDLCQKLGVGRGTVREAFRLLEAKGLVEIRPGRGAFAAAAPSPDQDSLVQWFVDNAVELRDCVEVRTALEPLAVRLMIERSDVADLAKLQRIHQHFVEAVEARDVAAIAKYDERFHSTIVEGSHNRLLIKMNHQTCEWIKSFRNRTFQVEQNALNAIEPHARILAAIQARDVDAGEASMRSHLQKVLEDMDLMTQSRTDK